MNVYMIDWIILLGSILALIAAAYATRKFSTSVADFLAANRCAGRYLLAVAEGLTAYGVIGIVAYFEMYYKAGFVPVWWTLSCMPVSLIISITGWVIYRFRQTRALTLAQFLEVRYSRKFRIFAGMVAFLSGIINFGIYPAVSARFFIYFCGLPDTVNILGIGFPTFASVMLILLAVSLYFTFVGGQVSVIVTDFLQGLFGNIVLAVVLIVVMLQFDWTKVVTALATAPENSSMLHPMHTGDVKDFNVWFFLIWAFAAFYNWMSWQGCQAYNSSAKNAHEAKMAKILAHWRGLIVMVVALLLPICAYTIMHHPEYAIQAGRVNDVLSRIGNMQIREQMTVPAATALMLPKGLLGAFCAVILMAFIANTNTYMHSWGSIFAQDIVLPMLKKPLTTKQHLWLLRGSIFGVTVFVFFFSLLFKQTQYILMFFAITSAIWMGGSGSVIIGGLYWKRGTTLGAYCSLIVGSVLAVGGIVAEQQWPKIYDGASFPINGQYMFFIAIMSSITTYIIVSLCDVKNKFNLDRMLHRGKYTLGEDSIDEGAPETGLKALRFGSLGTFGDKFIYAVLLIWTLGWTAIFLVGTVYNLTHDVSVEAWAKWWKFYIWLMFWCGIIVTIWFSIGGIRDMKQMLTSLMTKKSDEHDDGSVVDHHNLDEDFSEEKLT
ncbi:MAG: sodium:solute symporter [Planctomycetota bacterium]